MEIDKTGDRGRQKQLSLKYQVLSEATAIVGVLKQPNKATGEMEQSTLSFFKDLEPPLPPPPMPEP